MRIRNSMCLLLLTLGFCLPAAVSVAQEIPDPLGPDSVSVISSSASIGSGMIPAEIHFVNDELLAGMEVTLSWDSADLHVDSVSFAGGRLQSTGTSGWSSTANIVSIYAVAFGDLVPIGSGLLATVWFGYSTGIDAQIVSIDTITLVQGQAEYRTTFSDATSQYFIPQFTGGQLELVQTGCCIADRGNVDGSPDDAIDIGDLVFLVNYMFNDGAIPVCAEEADIDGNGAQDIGDLVTLVNYMFNDGPSPASCF